MLVREYRTYKYGVVDSLEDHSIPHGAASRSLGWQTKGDKIELMRGRLLLGTEVAGSGRISGIHVGEKSDGTQILFHSYARKVRYYDETTSDHIEISSNFLPATVLDDDGLGEDVSFAGYDSLAGAQVWLNSPNGTIAKIMTANPGSITDEYNSAKNYTGRIDIKQNRMLLWARPKDKTAPYGSYIDAAAYTVVTAEATTSLGGTLAFKGGGARRTCFAVAITITATSELYTDDFSGNLTGSLGGTGTINYTSGVYTLSNAGVGTADYQWEDSTNTGIADFSKSGTRTAGQGFVFRQDDGGSPLQSILTYKAIEYCLHRIRTWALSLTADDTNASNDIFRYKVGIPNWRAAAATGDGIYYVDDVDESEPRLRLLTFDPNGVEVVPVPISLNLRLDGYLFDRAATAEYGDLVLFACRTSDSAINNRVVAYNRIWKSLDILPYFVSCFAIYNGVLIAGDSGSSNLYELFSGLDDDDSTIENSWEGCLSDLELHELKKCKRIILEGEIGPDQNIDVYVSFDGGAYALLKDADDDHSIEGSGSYVDHSQSVNVGATTIGRKEVGGGGSDGAIPAHHYKRELRLDSDKFERVKLKFIATDIGFASVTTEIYKDIRGKGNKMASKYRT